MNFISRDGYTKNINMMDPRLGFKYGASPAGDGAESVLQLWNGRNVPGRAALALDGCASAELLKPYPQYLNMTQEWTNGRKSKYHTLELRAQRPFFNGMSMLAGYAYVRGSRQEFYDNVDEYDEVWTWTDVPDPRHRLNLSVVWEVPVGRDRTFGSGMNSAARRGHRGTGRWQAITGMNPGSICGSAA